MRIFFEEMMFHDPCIVVAEPVGGLQLRQRVLIKLEFVAGLPGAWQLQLVENAEFHHVSPGTGSFSQSTVFPCRAESSLRQFRTAEARLRRPHEWLVSLPRESSPRGTTSPAPRTHAHIYAASEFRAEGRCRLAESKARQE